jgi:protoporphyrinogen oxidase
MRIAIIGGGPAGLMTAYLLTRHDAPVDITLFEATDRLGGKIFTARFDHAPVAYEAGTAELYDYSMIGPDPLRELVRELGLTIRPLAGRTVVLDDQLLQTDDDLRRYLGQRALDALEDFRRRAKSLISPRDYYAMDWKDNSQDPLARQSFHELLASVPDESARKYIQVAVHSDLATEPHQTTALYGLHNFLMNEPSYVRLYRIEGGIDSLTKKLAENVSGRVLLGHRVTSVEKRRQGTYRVRSRRRDEILSEEFEIVVVALPNNWIPAIEWCGETLSKAMHLHHVQYDHPAHYLRVSMLFKETFWREQINESYFMLDAFGGCCVYDETSRSRTAPFGVLGWLVAGQAALNLSNFDDNTLIEQMLESLPRGLRCGREMLLEGRVHRWVGSVNGLPSGNPPTEPVSRHLPEPEENPRLLVVGDYLFDSTLNGVLDSAAVAVKFVLKEIPELVNERVFARSAV